MMLFALLFAAVLGNDLHEIPLGTAWNQWNSKYGDSELMNHQKVVNSDIAHRRFEVFAENWSLVRVHNSLPNVTYTMALNQFAALTNQEFASIHNGYKQELKQRNPNVRPAYNGVSDLPASKDWRAEGLVTKVKNQGSCGSCWAFSTVVSLEGQYMKAGGNLVSLSEQDLVDCVKKTKVNGTNSCCDGCQGGLMDNAFQYIIDAQAGVDDTEASYKYTGEDGTCKFKRNTKADAAKVTKFTDVLKGEDNLTEASANVGPISVAVNANIAWQLYHGGVLDPVVCPGSKLDHGVAVVGYGKGYWIIKNSWGATWGEKGYMKLVKGKNACGVQNSAVYPSLA